MGIQRANEDVENLLGHLGDPAEIQPCPPVNVAGRNACVGQCPWFWQFLVGVCRTARSPLWVRGIGL